MFNKYFITFYMIIFIGISYFAYTIFGERESGLIKSNSRASINEQSSEIEKSNIRNTPQENVIENLFNNEITQESDSTKDNIESPQETTSPENSNFYINVTPPDCTRECEPYKYDEKELEYCKNVCGLSPRTSENINCNDLSNLQRDYCIKDHAISEKDQKLCESIADNNIKTTCETRIQEDFLEQMM